MSGRQLLIDADVLVYEAAFSAQKTRYYYQQEVFDNAERAKEFCKENGLDYRAFRKDGSITSKVEIFPESAAKMMAVNKLCNILEYVGSQDYILFLSGKDNYRNDVATTKGYKANRTQPKPHHYELVRQHFFNHPNTEVMVGIEADDGMGIGMTHNPDAVICTIDKDLCQIPGRHYDWNKGLKYRVSDEESLYFFHHQLLTGDSTDNIPGIQGIGAKGADKALEGTMHNPQEGWKRVLENYTDMEYLTEQGRLLWIQRKPDEMWAPDQYEEEYLK